jgi:uncharacterized pyridoxamine 5'-phosphate oxidase family protein
MEKIKKIHILVALIFSLLLNFVFIFDMVFDTKEEKPGKSKKMVALNMREAGSVDKVIHFLSSSDRYFVATTNGMFPRISVTEYVEKINGKVSIFVNVTDELFRFITSSPTVEIVAFSGDNKKQITIAGAVTDKTNTETQNEAYVKNESFRTKYTDRGLFRVFSFDSGIATINTIETGEKEIIMF